MRSMLVPRRLVTSMRRWMLSLFIYYNSRNSYICTCLIGHVYNMYVMVRGS